MAGIKSKNKLIKQKKVSKQSKIKTPLKYPIKLSTTKNKKTTLRKPVDNLDEFVDEFKNDSSNTDSELDMDKELSENGEDILGIKSDEEDVDEEESAEKHKRDLEKLKHSDPEFYKFLQENDKKLLEFNLSDEDDDKDETEDDIHKPTDKLSVGSDESDFEDEDQEKPKDPRIITLKVLKSWQSEIQSDKTNKTIIAVMQAFSAALRTVSNDGDQEAGYYKVEGSAVFNGVIQLCVLELGPAIRRFLRLQPGSKQPPHKCKKFIKIKKSLKSYFSDILKLLKGVSSSNIHTVLLKHLHYMSTLLTSYPNITKSLVKHLIQLWGTKDDSVRVMAFFCILRITNNQQAFILDTVLKSMYMTYVKNSKFVSFKNLPVINFMRRSLVEMYALDVNFAYRHVFLYIRQLAIHLRNAITINKKENVQAVYNWQFINSLKLWGCFLAVTYNKKIMQQLIYPFVQICIGSIKLVPTAQYYPLRFHIVQILIDLSKDTGVFIPILPFLLEVLTTQDFNKKHKRVSMKPLQFTCLLRLSKSQLQENGFKDTVIETIYGLLLEYLSSQSHTLGFPDMSLISVIQIKKFIKTCKNPNYFRKFKQILEKIEQNSKYIENGRAKLNLNLNDFKLIEGWEAQIKEKKPPLTVYYESWQKLTIVKKNKQMTKNDELADYKLPTLKKTQKEAKKNEGPVELFPSDSEEETSEKRKRGKRGGKKHKKSSEINAMDEDDGINEKDIVEDIQEDDW
ncbi:nucleolar complex protein 2 homolog [Diorhabda sublineata]|uniref:nucleolar complex protein 2 homolog n=1 Tax=Diorhabda sublineata TaxID=1163346 RepID=UPI0024E0A2D1|nr:nucleolar complex protein 2 homolog [Diorhabda sublineata]